MKIIGVGELEALVRKTFPGKDRFCANAELGLQARRAPIVSFVHGGPDPFLDRYFEAWLAGSKIFVPVYQILNRLCRAGALAPGSYAVAQR